jgi:uncharacterized protein YqeY
MEQGNRLKQKLSEDLRQAMKSGQIARRECIRLLISAVNYTEIARQAPLTDADIYGVIAKEIKQRRESIEAFTAGNRPDLVAKEEAELAILLEYQPRQMSREEVTAEAKKIITEVGAQGARDKGKVMPKLMAQLKGKADGRMINEVVTELLK